MIREWSSTESAQRKADEQAILSAPFHGAIKGYSEPLKMPSILFEKEIEQHFLKPLQKAIYNQYSRLDQTGSSGRQRQI